MFGSRCRGGHLNLSHTLFRSARRLPRAVAVIERDRIELSYQQLAERSLRVASALMPWRNRIALARALFKKC